VSDDGVDQSPGDHTVTVEPRAIRPCEREQAERFATILGQELLDMRRTAATAEKQWLHRKASDGRAEPPERLDRLRGRIAEADRLLKALNERFDFAR
jgi:hypothetical protein